MVREKTAGAIPGDASGRPLPAAVPADEKPAAEGAASDKTRARASTVRQRKKDGGKLRAGAGGKAVIAGHKPGEGLRETRAKQKANYVVTKKAGAMFEVGLLMSFPAIWWLAL